MRQSLVLLMIGVIVSGCTENDSMELADFTSDGCSLFIDGTFENPELWKECCLKHDIAYWQGGTKEQREQADLDFKNCVEKKTGDSTLAYLMYEAVRAEESLIFLLGIDGGMVGLLVGDIKNLPCLKKKVVEEKLKKYRNSK